MRDAIVRLAFLALATSLTGLERAHAQQQAQPGAFQSIAPVVILTDFDTGSVLFEKSADTPSVPASTAKLMTAEVVFHEIQQGRLKLDDEFTVSENAWRTGGALSRGSSMFAALNSHIRVEDLIRGLVVDSGNDAAIILAEGVAGTEQAFVQKMNARAKDLGLTDLSFRNAWGKDDPAQRVTARAMAQLAAHVIRTYPDLYRYFSEKEFTWSKIKQQNRNPLLTMDIGADGLKTGNIDEKSGYSLVGSAVENGQRLILALYGMHNAKERSEEARKLFQWGFRSFEPRSVFTSGETVGYARLYGGAQFDVPLATEFDIRILIPRGSSERVSGKIEYEGPIPAPVEAGKELARLKIFRGQTLALDAPLNAAESVPQGPLYRRAFDAGYELSLALVRKYVFKK